MLLFFIMTTLAVVLKVFVFTSFKVPTSSMKPGILPGDFVLVEKLTFGARLYRMPGYLKGERSEMTRWKGLRKIRRNDVLVFNIPYSGMNEGLSPEWNTFYVKRCVAAPGDTFYIENGIYRVKGITDSPGMYHRQVRLSEPANSDFSGNTPGCFPHDSTFNWTPEHFGPLYVPGRGSHVAIDARNIALYKNLITYETGRKIHIGEGCVYMGNMPLSSYTFTKDYYFMAGDNVSGSLDSRYWGLLPEDLIVGKAAFIWKSVDPYTKKYRWKRFFKTL